MITWVTPVKAVTGLFYGDSKQIVAQFIEVIVCIGWNVVVGGVVFFILDKIVGNRVTAAEEIAGLDMPEMGALAYPDFFKGILPEAITPEMIEKTSAGELVIT